MTGIIKHSLMITVFVFTMMLLVEYINVFTSGKWQTRILKKSFGQYIFASLMGIVPGCLGPFVVVAMFSHGILTIGAVVTAMIATSGDETYMMLSMIPKQTLILTSLLFVTGIIAGIATDIILKKVGFNKIQCCEDLETHDTENCKCFPREMIIMQWIHCKPSRGILTTVLILIIAILAAGWIGPSSWNWIRVTFLLTSTFTLFIVATVPDHFLIEHLWKHVVLQHVPKVFVWTFGALMAMYVLTEYLHLEYIIREEPWLLLVIACLVGVIPESGPHLIFVMFYGQGLIPFSVLLASSIVQDGHGMLPLIAHSRKAFLMVKTINFLVGITVGTITLVLGF